MDQKTLISGIYGPEFETSFVEFDHNSNHQTLNLPSFRSRALLTSLKQGSNSIMASRSTPRRKHRVRERRANSLPTNVLTKDNNKSWTQQDFDDYEEQLKAQLIILRSIVCTLLFIISLLYKKCKFILFKSIHIQCYRFVLIHLDTNYININIQQKI